jgi:hypothetical protein
MNNNNAHQGAVMVAAPTMAVAPPMMANPVMTKAPPAMVVSPAAGTLMQVQIPAGFFAGQSMLIQAPDGTQFNVQVPPGAPPQARRSKFKSLGAQPQARGSSERSCTHYLDIPQALLVECMWRCLLYSPLYF